MNLDDQGGECIYPLFTYIKKMDDMTSEEMAGRLIYAYFTPGLGEENYAQ